MADPELSELSEADQAKLKALEAAWKLDGTAVFDRLRDTDFVTYFRIIGSLNPKAIGAALEEELLEIDMTYQEFLAMCLKRAQQLH